MDQNLARPWVTRTGQAGTRRVVTYTYDAMSRLQGVAANWDNNPTTSVNVAANAQYNFQGAMTSLNILGQTETRQYNTLGQLTRIQGAGINIEYQFSATANDGKITGQKNWATGEEVTYQYDALERLISAATAASTGSSAWGLSWSYDGFGNRLNQNVTKGTAPTMSTLVDANTNRLSGFGYSYDGNGNLLTMPQQSASMTYDGSNRMVTFTNQNDTESYQYAPDNKRVWRSKGCSYQSVVDGSTQVAPALTFYSVFGQKLGDYCYPPGGGQVVEENVHFGGRIVAKGDAGGSLVALATDRLHSKGDGSTFFPYGETKSGTAITGDSFATYSRDWTGLDYADQRWYAPGVGRFTASDPYERSAQGERSGSWNRFAYVEGGPIDSHDPKGLATCRLISQVYGAGIIGSFAEVHCTSEGGTIQRQEWRSFGTTDVSAIEAEFLVTLGRQIDAEEWTLTENAVRQALGIISTGISDDCWNNQLSRMFRLYSSDVPGVSRSSISQAAMSVILINGLTTLDSAQGVLISDRFRERERLYALARLDGNKIYWRPGRYEGSSENWIFGSVLHEVLHNVGFTDSQIQTGLFLLPDADNTDNISATLARDCFR